MIFYLFTADWESVSEDHRAEGKDEAAHSEEGEGLSRRHAGGAAGLQGEGVCGLQGQPQDCEERGGEGKSGQYSRVI